MVKAKKRPRAQSHGNSSPWLDLEPGVWQMVFASLESADKRSARLVCHHFNQLASQMIRTLDVRRVESVGDFSVTSRLLLEAQTLPGSLTEVECLTADQRVCEDLSCTFENFSRLRQLKLYGSEGSTHAAMQVVSSLKTLRKLQLHRFSLRDTEAIAGLQSLPLLTHLELSKCTPVNAEVMMLVGKLTGLSALELTKPYSFRDIGYSALGSLTNLTSLKIGYSWTLGIGGENLVFFSNLVKLKHLNILKCFVNDASLAPLSSLTSIQLLGILHCSGVTGSIFRELTGLVQLQGLTLQGSNKITDQGIMHIASITSLRALHLDSEEFSLYENQNVPKLVDESEGVDTFLSGACKANLVHLTNLARLKVPPQVAHDWTEDQVKALLPSLVSYMTSSQRELREPGLMEERLRRTAGMGLPGPPVTDRLFQWFHTGPDKLFDVEAL